MQYNVYLEFSSLLFLGVIIAFYFSKAHFFHLSNKIFACYLVTSFSCITLNIVTAFTISYAAKLPIWINEILNPVFYFFQMLQAIEFAAFVLSLVGYLVPENKHRVMIIMSPSVPALLYALAAPMLGSFVFSFDSQGVYHHGKGFFLLYLFSFYFIFLGIHFAISYHKMIPAIQFYTILFFTAMILLLIFAQIRFPSILLSGLACTLSTLMMYMTFQDPLIYIDDLTGLYERKTFLTYSSELLNYKKEFDVILIDIHNLKFINSHLGLTGGDRLLLQIAKILRENYSYQQIFRIDGDKFAIISNKHSDKTLDQLKKRFNDGIHLLGNQMKVSLHICKINMSEYASSAEDVFIIGENIFSYLKENTQESCIEITKETIELFRKNQSIEQAVLTGIENDRLSVYFQPIINMRTGKPTAAEALLRLEDPELGLISPEVFIPIAEKKGLINRIGEIVLEKTCQFVSEKALWTLGIEIVHINLSTIQCMDLKLCDRILQTISNFDLPFSILNFEITETATIASKQQLLTTMNQLEKFGITFAMDDYGNGLSNNQTLIDFPFDIIKIDRSLLWNCDKNKQAGILYQNVVKMFKQMGLIVIAEGAETQEQVAFLKELGVNFIQGYYYSKPLPQEDFLKFITD